jgi:hypothetical protein
MILYSCVLIVFLLHRESLKLILVDDPPPSPRWFCHTLQPIAVVATMAKAGLHAASTTPRVGT